MRCQLTLNHSPELHKKADRPHPVCYRTRPRLSGSEAWNPAPRSFAARNAPTGCPTSTASPTATRSAIVHEYERQPAHRLKLCLTMEAGRGATVSHAHHRAVLATQVAMDGAAALAGAVRRGRTGRVIISTRGAAVKTRNLRRHPYASLCVISDGFFGPWVQVEGEAEIISLPDAMELLVEYYRRIAGEHPDWDGLPRRHGARAAGHPPDLDRPGGPGCQRVDSRDAAGPRDQLRYGRPGNGSSLGRGRRAGSGAGPWGRPRRERAASRARHPSGNTEVPRRRCRGYSRQAGHRSATWPTIRGGGVMRELDASGPETCGERVARRGVNGADHRPSDGNSPGQRACRRKPSDWLANSPLNACRRRAGRAISRADPLFPGGRGGSVSRAGRVARRARWRGLAGPMGRPFSDHKFRDRKCLLAQHRKRRFIHSLTGQLLERDQSFPLNGRHIRSPPPSWPPRPPGGPVRSSSGNRLRCIGAGQEAGDKRAPGRGRTDTGDPFRGRPLPLGYGGWVMIPRLSRIIERPAYGVEKDPLRCIYSILRS